MFTLTRNIKRAVSTAQKMASSLHETLFIILKDKNFYLATRAERYSINHTHRVDPTSLTIKPESSK